MVPPAPFLQCQPHLTPDGSGVLADPHRIDEEFRKAWLLYVCRSGQREASLEEFDREVDGWLPLLPVVALPRLTGEMLADVVRRKGATTGSLDGWGWMELKVLPAPWFVDGLARILSKVEETGVWPEGLLDAYIAMIPKTDGDATPLGLFRREVFAWVGVLRALVRFVWAGPRCVGLGRRLRAVWDVIAAIGRSGFTVSRDLELTRQWGSVVAGGPQGTVTAEALARVAGLGSRLGQVFAECCSVSKGEGCSWVEG